MNILFKKQINFKILNGLSAFHGKYFQNYNFSFYNIIFYNFVGRNIRGNIVYSKKAASKINKIISAPKKKGAFKLQQLKGAAKHKIIINERTHHRKSRGKKYDRYKHRKIDTEVPVHSGRDDLILSIPVKKINPYIKVVPKIDKSRPRAISYKKILKDSSILDPNIETTKVRILGDPGEKIKH